MLEKDSTVIISKKENTSEPVSSHTLHTLTHSHTCAHMHSHAEDGRVEEVVCGVVTSADLLGYLCSQAPQ